MASYQKVLPDPDRDKLLAELHTWEQDLKPLRRQWDVFWERWELLPPDSNDNPYISMFQSPYPFSHVETIVPRIVGDDPQINYVAMDNEEDDPKAAMLSAVVNWQLQMMRFEGEVRNFIRQACITGYSVAKVGWIRQSEVVTAEVIRQTYHEALDTTLPTRANEDVEWVKRNEAFFETVDVYDFVWPVRSISLNKCPAVWQRSWMRYDHLQEQQAQGHLRNVDQVTPYGDAMRRNDLMVRYAAQGLHPQDIAADELANEVEVWERWQDDRLVTIANRSVVLRDDPNPFNHKRKPFVDYAPVERPFSLHGVGVIKMLYDMNEDLAAMRRQRRDAITFTLNPMWKATEGVRESDVKIRPGGVWRVPDTEDVEPATNPQVDFSASYQEEQNAKNDMQQVTGAFDYLAGVNPGGVQTATGVSTIANEGNKRIAEMVRVFVERTMKPLGYQLAALCVQYLDQQVAIPLYQYPEAAQAWKDMQGVENVPRIVEVGSEDITTAGQVMPLPQAGSDRSTTDIQKRSDAVQTIQAIAPILAAPVPVVDPKALVEYVLKQFGVDRHDRAKILDTQNAQPVPQPQQNGSSPPGGVVGTPGVAGPSG